MTHAHNGSAPSTSPSPVTDLPAWLAALPSVQRDTLRAHGELLTGVASTPGPETPDSFAATRMGVPTTNALWCESREFGGAQILSRAIVLGRWIADHPRVEIGPGDWKSPPSFTETLIGEDRFHHPRCLSAFFPANTLLEHPCVVTIDTKVSMGSPAEIEIYIHPEHQQAAVALHDRLAAEAVASSPFRGRILRAVNVHGGLAFEAATIPEALTRDTVIVPESTWKELDLGAAAVRDHHEILNRHGLGCRRGVLLCGPPGVGKSAVSAVIARELQAVGFTVMFVDADAARILTHVVEEAVRLAPTVLLMEDLDLWARDRRMFGDRTLSELLQAMDIRPDARILCIASTNDLVGTLDTAAVRTGRFDGICEISWPSRPDAARILAALIAGIPGGDSVDTAAVAAQLPERTSGSDLREIVRRATISGQGEVSTDSLTAEVGAGRYRVAVPGTGTYL